MTSSLLKTTTIVETYARPDAFVNVHCDRLRRHGPARQALSSLGDATRRRIYDHVARRPAPGEPRRGRRRDRHRPHARRLPPRPARGRRPAHRRRTSAARAARARAPAGPRSCTPASEREVAVSVPPRDYRLAARLLADAAAARHRRAHPPRAVRRGRAPRPRDRRRSAADRRPRAAAARARLRARTRTSTASSGCATARSTPSPSATPRSSAT